MVRVCALRMNGYAPQASDKGICESNWLWLGIPPKRIESKGYRISTLGFNMFQSYSELFVHFRLRTNLKQQDCSYGPALALSPVRPAGITNFRLCRLQLRMAVPQATSQMRQVMSQFCVLLVLLYNLYLYIILYA